MKTPKGSFRNRGARGHHYRRQADDNLKGLLHYRLRGIIAQIQFRLYLTVQFSDTGLIQI